MEILQVQACSWDLRDVSAPINGVLGVHAGTEMPQVHQGSQFFLFPKDAILRCVPVKPKPPADEAQAQEAAPPAPAEQTPAETPPEPVEAPPAATTVYPEDEAIQALED